MRPDFSRIWGSDNAPFTPIEASDYAAGWVFRTGAPPRRVNFDYFQNLSDQRTAWLGEQMLLAVGHEWQDDVTYDEYAIVRSPVDGQLYRSMVGGNLGNEPSASGAKWAIGVQPQSADYLNTTRIDVASASTVNLTTAAPNTRHINITGTTAITEFTVAAGQCYFVRFDDALTLTNNASIVTQSGANIITSSGDTCIIRATGGNVVEVLSYEPAGGWARSLTSSGYQKLPSGLIVQWGTVTIPGNSTANATYAITFPDTVFIIGTNRRENLTATEPSLAYATTNSKISIVNGGSGSQVHDFWAIGK